MTKEEMIEKRLGMNCKVKACAQEYHYTVRFKDGFEMGLYTDNALYFKKAREFQRGRLEMLHDKWINAQERYRTIPCRSLSVCSDAGSISIGTADFISNIPNHWGDGSFVVRAYDEDIDLEDVQRGWKFSHMVEGNFYVFSYDCLSREERQNAIAKGRLLHLDGRYAVYSRDARSCLAFVRTRASK